MMVYKVNKLQVAGVEPGLKPPTSFKRGNHRRRTSERLDFFEGHLHVGSSVISGGGDTTSRLLYLSERPYVACDSRRQQKM